MSKQEIFYTSPNGAGGDIIPFYDEGEYRLFLLGKGRTCVSMKDHLHSRDEYKTGIHGGTGSVLKVDGMYHMSYCKFTFHPYMRQYVCHATSKDMVNWVEHPAETFQPDDVIYEMSDWRDPHVIWNEEEQCWWMLLAAQAKGKTMRKGCVGLCTSKDLTHWEIQQPLYVPKTNQSASECRDIFQWGDWWYLTCSVYTDRVVTLYRKARPPAAHRSPRMWTPSITAASMPPSTPPMAQST